MTKKGVLASCRYQLRRLKLFAAILTCAYLAAAVFVFLIGCIDYSFPYDTAGFLDWLIVMAILGFSADNATDSLHNGTANGVSRISSIAGTFLSSFAYAAVSAIFAATIHPLVCVIFGVKPSWFMDMCYGEFHYTGVRGAYEIPEIIMFCFVGYIAAYMLSSVMASAIRRYRLKAILAITVLFAVGFTSFTSEPLSIAFKDVHTFLLKLFGITGNIDDFYFAGNKYVGMTALAVTAVISTLLSWIFARRAEMPSRS